jgi:putative transposase
VWAAIDDADTKELLAVYASYYYRSSINTIIFLRKVLDTCVGTPVVLVDGGLWYPWALDRMDWDAVASQHVRLQERGKEVL